MTTTLSVRIDSDTKNQLEALAKRARRSKSFLAAEAIAAYVEAERWQLDEIQAGLQELDRGRAVAQKDVSKWLRSWGKKREPGRGSPRGDDITRCGRSLGGAAESGASRSDFWDS
jgi:RHH-type rel operon transcriptional repressor/antitoxin RelB